FLVLAHLKLMGNIKQRIVDIMYIIGGLESYESKRKVPMMSLLMFPNRFMQSKCDNLKEALKKVQPKEGRLLTSGFLREEEDQIKDSKVHTLVISFIIKLIDTSRGYSIHDFSQGQCCILLNVDVKNR
ncbi:hypothetical protein ACJX0J_015926, partial [Zea mays]